MTTEHSSLLAHAGLRWSWLESHGLLDQVRGGQEVGWQPPPPWLGPGRSWAGVTHRPEPVYHKPHEPQCTGTKMCADCHEELNVLAFAACATCVDGLQPICRQCHLDRYPKGRNAEPLVWGHTLEPDTSILDQTP